MLPPRPTHRLGSEPSLEYIDRGALSATPVIALHGVTDSWRSFQPLLPHLPATLRLVAPSQRGHGDSDKPAGGYRPRDFAGDVVRLMDALQLPRAVIVGHSMGGVVAQRLAIDHPDRVLGLVLAGTTSAFHSNPDLVAWWRHDITTLADPIAPLFARDFQLSTLAQPVPPAFVDLAVSESLKVPAHVWRAAFEGFMTEDRGPELARIQAPTLLVWGARDTICSAADQQRLVAAIRGARLQTYHAAGHAMHWEEPQRFAHDLAAFVAEVAVLPAAVAA